MKRTDRMFAIVTDLQARRILRAEDLAARYETSVRTIYRDVTALGEAGVPVISLPGQGYTLPADYFLPPLALGLDEAVALLLGADYVAQTLDAAYARAAQGAIGKLEAIVPAAVREPLARARRSIRLIGRELSAAQRALLQLLRAAIADGRVVRFRYRGRRTDDDTGRGDAVRRIAPYALAHMGGHWYLVGHSYERGAVRRFRLSRIDDAAVGADTFERPADFRIEPPDPATDLPIEVKIAFAGSELAAMHERLSGFAATLQPAGEDWVATFRTHSEAALVPYVLSWGGGVRVVEPPGLSARVAAEARRILHNAPDTPLSAGAVYGEVTLTPGDALQRRH